jgi:hypothetical protein
MAISSKALNTSRSSIKHHLKVQQQGLASARAALVVPAQAWRLLQEPCRQLLST